MRISSLNASVGSDVVAGGDGGGMGGIFIVGNCFPY